MVRRFTRAALVLLIVGCGGKEQGGTKPKASRPVASAPAAPEPKADVVVTLEDYAREYESDPKAAAAKYAGKEVELSATVWAVREPGPPPRLALVVRQEPQKNTTAFRDF